MKRRVVNKTSKVNGARSDDIPVSILKADADGDVQNSKRLTWLFLHCDNEHWKAKGSVGSRREVRMSSTCTT